MQKVTIQYREYFLTNVFFHRYAYVKPVILRGITDNTVRDADETRKKLHSLDHSSDSKIVGLTCRTNLCYICRGSDSCAPSTIF